MRVDGEIAFVLHTRAYRETSQLVDLFSRRYGRFRVVAKGSRGAKSLTSKSSKILQPFTPLQISWSGKGELKTLLSSETVMALPLLQGERLYSGFYLNELLLRLLTEHDPHEQLFDQYHDTLMQLSRNDSLETLLRTFELRLLEEIGYGLVVDIDAESGEPVREEGWYWFDPQQGFVERLPPQGNDQNPVGSVAIVCCR